MDGGYEESVTMGTMGTDRIFLCDVSMISLLGFLYLP